MGEGKSPSAWHDERGRDRSGETPENTAEQLQVAAEETRAEPAVQTALADDSCDEAWWSSGQGTAGLLMAPAA